MIKLSDMLIATLDDKDPLIALQINEAKRLEALDVPRVEPERKPLVDGDGDKVYIIVDENGVYADWQLTERDAENDARDRTEDTGQPHTVCQVMAPESGECPTIPVETFAPTPEREHEWVIYNASGRFESRWFAVADGCSKYWALELTNKKVQRFATATAAQNFIDANKIADAYPWPVPKLTG